VNLFARWATAPSFRFWWPIASTMYSPGFRRFIDERFPMPGPPDDVTPRLSPVRIPQRGRVEILHPDAPDGLAAMWWKERSTQRRNWNGRRLYQDLVDLPLNHTAHVPLQVGIVAVAVSEKNNVGWTSDDFFVPPSLWGAGIGWHFLDNLLNTLNETHQTSKTTVYVIVKAVPSEAQHRIAVDDQLSFIEQYRKIGFRRENVPANAMENFDASLLEQLGLAPDDTLFTLELKSWSRRRGRPR